MMFYLIHRLLRVYRNGLPHLLPDCLYLLGGIEPQPLLLDRHGGSIGQEQMLSVNNGTIDGTEGPRDSIRHLSKLRSALCAEDFPRVAQAHHLLHSPARGFGEKEHF